MYVVQERGKSSELEVSYQHIDDNRYKGLYFIHLGDCVDRGEVIIQRNTNKYERRGRELCKRVTKKRQLE